jgi:hypothetical protein
MARPTKEFRAFSTLVDRLLAVSRVTLDTRLAEYREAPSVGAKRGPKPKSKRPSSS